MNKKKIITITIGFVALFFSTCLAVTKDNLSGMKKFIDEEQNRRYEILTAQVKNKEIVDITESENWDKYKEGSLIYEKVSFEGEVIKKLEDSYIIALGDEKKGYKYYQIEGSKEEYGVGAYVKVVGRIFGEKSSEGLFPILVSTIE